MSNKLLLKSFAGGEITPELAGRLDLTKYQTGLALCRNFTVLPHGPITRRPGFEFVIEAWDSTLPVRLIPFAFSATQTAVLEFGDAYIRFHVDGGTVLETAAAIASVVGSTVTIVGVHTWLTGDVVYIGSRYHTITVIDASSFTTADAWGSPTAASGTQAARVYTLASPYSAAYLFDLHFTQSSDVITIVHPQFEARELRRLGATNWTLTPISFAASNVWPDNVVATATIATGGSLSPQRYVVTAVDDDGVTESLPSAPTQVSNNLNVSGNYNTVTWDAVDGKNRYNVYKQRGGTFGYIGQVVPVVGVVKTIGTIIRVFGSTRVDVVTTAAHGFSTGNVVFINATGVATFDGAWAIAVDSATQFHYTSKKSTSASAALGSASIPSLTLTDDNVQADTTQSPPDDIIALNSDVNDYPAATAYHEQRRWFAGTNEKPQVLWGTRTGTEANLTSSIPSRDADALELRVASMQNNQILHLVPLTDMIAFTAGGEFRVFADGAPAITPTSVSIKPQGYSGANNVQPVVTSGSILYVQSQGSHVREFAYGGESSNYGFKSVDISIMAPHRFNGHSLTQLAYVRAPEPTAWAVRNDGVLMGLTYVPEQQVYAWHAHDTEGLVESVCVVAEGSEDVLYVVAQRTVNERAVRYIERLRTRLFSEPKDAFFVDSGLTYDGAPTTTVSGLYHLEGCTVDILADAAVETRQTVTNGTVTLGTAASVVHVGLPITADAQTLPLTMEGAQALGQGTTKNVSKVHMRVSQSSLVQAGPTFDRLREYPARAVTDPYGSPPALRDGEVSLSIDPAWNQEGGVCVRQDKPLPLTVLSMTLEMQGGG